MKNTLRSATTLCAAVGLSLIAGEATAQDGPPQAGPVNGGETSVQMMPGPTTTTTTQTPAGPAAGEVDKYLPSSSQSLTDINASRDTFDLNQGDPGAASARGGATGQYVLEGAGVPQAHTVKRGDTLWGISGQYYKNAYTWPRLWAQNPQIQNPHWIYPGDRLRLRADEARGGGIRGRTVPEKTVFLRNYGWVDDPDKDDWGEVVGSPEDQMMLGPEDDVYVQLDDDAKVELGQELTLWKEIRTLRGREAEASGELVKVVGTIRIDRYNAKTKMARAHVIEGLDVVERGIRVGPVSRKFLVVPPAQNEKYVEARILTALLPHEFFGQHQVVFLDRGSKQGIKPGNRFYGVRRGDRWVEALGTAGPQATTLPSVEDDRDAVMEDMKADGPKDKYPNEMMAEVRVLDVRENTCVAIVMESSYEIERDTVLVMKKGH